MHIPFVDLKIQHKTIMAEVDKKLLEIATSGYFIKGPELTNFEKKFAKFIGTKYCIGVASGTDALTLSLTALNVKKDDEVLIPVNTFISTAYAVIRTGAKPIFVDMNKDTFNIDVNKIETSITKKTKAIIPVHLYGQPAEMDKLMAIAKKYKIFVLEDAAQAHGALFKNKKTGSFGTLAAFSFYPSKNLGAYGDGGAITTNSISLYERLIGLREYGGGKYYYSEIGTNSRLDAIQAGILSVKLKHLDTWNAKRRILAQSYTKSFLRKIPEVVPPIASSNTKPVFHLYVIKCSRRDELQKYLERKGIETGIHYPALLHQQKSLKFLGYKNGDFPVAEAVVKQILSLPMFPELSHRKQDYVVNTKRQKAF